MLLSPVELQSFIPVCYHPMTVVLVDDDKAALKNAHLLLKDYFPCKTFSKPLEALDFLNNQYQEKSFMSRCFKPLSKSGRDRRVSGIDFSKIHEEIYRNQRFSQISTIIVDYAMPEMNGLEFSRQLKNPKFKTILLTGEASVDTALQALNRHEIQHFLAKDQDAETIQSSLHQWISEIQKDYFSSYSLPAITSLLLNQQRPIDTLVDPAYIDTVHATMASCNAIECYLADVFGSMVMFDGKGKASWLVIYDEQEKNDLVKLAIARGAPEEIVRAAKSDEMMLYFFAGEELSSSPQFWRSCLYPSKKLKGNKDYWYTNITDLSGKLKAKITSFNEYLNSHQ